MKSSARKIQIQSFEDLFAGGNSGGQEEQGGEQIREIALGELFPFHAHPFKVLDDDSMNEMVESIRAHGVLVPGIARARKEGGYELIAGHRRKRASELAGKTTMPVIIREAEDDDAVLEMVDSNLQRENLLPSEKAWAYRMKLEALRRKAGRPAKENCGQVVHNFKGKKSLEIVAEDTGENYKQVQRYIRLTELLPEMLQMVDDKKLLFNPAVELSYLSDEEQGKLKEVMEKLSVIPSLEQAKHMKERSRTGELTTEVMKAVLAQERAAPVNVTIKSVKLKEFFPTDYTQKQMEDVIFSLLEAWKEEHSMA